MNASSGQQMQSGMILRVLTGRQRDARYRLSPGLAVSVGHSFAHDIVLRGGARDLSLRLKLGADVSMMEVVSGSITLLGQQLGEGAKAQLPPYVPFEAGGVFIAIGDAQSERWAEAQLLAKDDWDTGAGDETPADTETSGKLDPQPVVPSDSDAAPAENQPGMLAAMPFETATVQNMLTHFSTRYRLLADRWQLDRRWPMLAAAAAFLLIGLVGYAPACDWIRQSSNDPVAVTERLERTGFAGVTVERAADGRLRFTGLLRKDSDVERLRAMARDKYPDAELAVQSMDGIADAATAILEAQALDAQAKPGKGRSLVIESEYLPADRQAEIKAAILKDMPLIKAVSFALTGLRGDENLQYFFSTSSFGYATYVEGDPSYIRTADGTTWMKGAKLPTGHVVLDIADGRIRFERMGIIEDLVVIEGAGSAAAADASASEEKVSPKSETTV